MLANPTLALETIDSITTMPTGAVEQLLEANAAADCLTDVMREGRVVSMFALDLKMRGAEVIISRSARAYHFRHSALWLSHFTPQEPLRPRVRATGKIDNPTVSDG